MRRCRPRHAAWYHPPWCRGSRRVIEQTHLVVPGDPAAPRTRRSPSSPTKMVPRPHPAWTSLLYACRAHPRTRYRAAAPPNAGSHPPHSSRCHTFLRRGGLPCTGVQASLASSSPAPASPAPASPTPASSASMSLAPVSTLPDHPTSASVRMQPYLPTLISSVRTPVPTDTPGPCHPTRVRPLPSPSHVPINCDPSTCPTIMHECNTLLEDAHSNFMDALSAAPSSVVPTAHGRARGRATGRVH